jgi:hypothetical protein
VNTSAPAVWFAHPPDRKASLETRLPRENLAWLYFELGEYLSQAGRAQDAREAFRPALPRSVTQTKVSSHNALLAHWSACDALTILCSFTQSPVRRLLPQL